mgnify:CR=1 FL=1
MYMKITELKKYIKNLNFKKSISIYQLKKS